MKTLPWLARASGHACVASAIGAVSVGAHAQTDRDRAQMAQLVQQLQKVQQQNAQLAAELQQSKAPSAEAAKLKIDAEQSRQETARLRASAAAGQQGQRRSAQELDKARDDLTRTQAELERVKLDLARRTEAAQQASSAFEVERRAVQTERSTAGALLASTEKRAALCEAQHTKLQALGTELVDELEQQRTRTWEPFTGLWRVKEEQRVQTWRDQLFDARLDGAAKPRP